MIEATEEIRLDELCLPTASSQFGRETQWSALLDAYRRVAGVPSEPEFSRNVSTSSLPILAEGSLLNIAADIDANRSKSGAHPQRRSSKNSALMTSDSSTICSRTQTDDSSSYKLSSEVVMVRGKAGTGKSLLVQKLQDCIDALDEDQYDPLVDDDEATGVSTLPSVSGGARRPSHGSMTSVFSLNYAELPTGVFAQGSFTHGTASTATPYSGFTAAFNDLIAQLVTDECVDQMSLTSKVMDAVGLDVETLMDIVPNLRLLVGKDAEIGGTPKARSQGEGSLLTTDSSQGLRFIFRSFVEAISIFVGHYYGGPLVLFLDDSECIDPASVALLSALTTESTIDNLLIVLSVRTEMYDQDHPLRDVSKTIEESEAIQYTEIEIEDLSKEQVNSLVAKALRKNHSDPDSVLPLSDIVYQRTLGNGLFVVEFLRSLVERELLEFNLGLLSWTWQIDKIQAETCVSDNVVDLVTGKIKNLPAQARYVLVLASCLHSTVELDVLATIVCRYPRIEESSKSWVTDHEMMLTAIECPEDIGAIDVLDILTGLVSIGLMEQLAIRGDNGKAFKFAHERIRHAAQAIIPDDLAGKMLHVRVGELLREMVLGDNAQTWTLFSCLDHLNQAREALEESHLLELVDLNLLTGKKAANLSAFLPASKYFKSGLGLLDKKSSLNDNELNLQHQLKTQLSISLYRCGDLEGSETVAKAFVAGQAVLNDKLPLYFNLIAVYKAQGKLEDAVNIGMELLKAVGEKFTKKPSKFRLQMETRKVQKLLKKYTDEQLTDLPPCSNEMKAAAVNVYAVLFGPMFHLGCPGAVDLLRLRSIYLTIKYGFTDASALAFAYYGSHLISQKDIAGGYRFGKLSQKLMAKTKTDELTCRTSVVSNFLILHWKDPLSQTLDRLMKSYIVGLKQGDIEMAMTSCGIYQTHYYYCGLPLNTGEKDLRAFIKQMKEYGQKKELSQYLPLWQMMLNLMSKSENPTLLTGDAMDQAEFEQSSLGVVVMKSYRMQLAYYYDELELAGSLMDDLRPHSNSFVAPFFQIARRFFFALIRMGVARKAPMNKRKKLLQKIKKEDIDWLEERVSAGAINCLHKLYILKAEMATFDSGKDVIKKAFEQAIMTSSRAGFSQDEALANELAASYFLSVGDFPNASDYLTRAHEKYSQWGALGKVKQLEQKYVLIKGDANGSGGGRRVSRNKNHKGRQRFSSRFSDCHKSVCSSDNFGALGEDEKPKSSSTFLSLNEKGATAA